jgi:hypothetical protein
VTKKEIYELLDENVLTITVVTNDGEIAYEGPVSKLKAAVKSADVSVNQASNYDKYYLVCHRTIVVKGSSIAPLVIMRKKR